MRIDNLSHIQELKPEDRRAVRGGTPREDSGLYMPADDKVEYIPSPYGGWASSDPNDPFGSGDTGSGAVVTAGLSAWTGNYGLAPPKKD